MSRPGVSLLSLHEYQPDAVVARMRELLEPLGGMRRFVPKGARVVLKPNLVFGRHADKAINTHPSVVRAAAILAREAGAGWIGMGDSPGFGSAASASRAAGLLPVVEEMGMELVEFTPVSDSDEKRSFVRLELARELLEADVIINLAKMKTHGQMLMTLAVKNMFGAVPGARKFQWHYRAGRDRLLFARVINEIARRVRPTLSILDAVVGMDGMGPTAGRVRPVGFLAASSDPWALDATVMDILGVKREELFTLADAMKSGQTDWSDPVLYGDPPEGLRPDDWNIPQLRSLQMHGGTIEKYLPGLAAWLRRKITPFPVAGDACTGCGYCVDICPAKAMRLQDGRVMVDDAACIRCYCCHELCQQHGLELKSGGLVAHLLGIGDSCPHAHP